MIEDKDLMLTQRGANNERLWSYLPFLFLQTFLHIFF